MQAIFEFTDPIKYLQDYLEELPKKGWGVRRRLAEHLGVNTSLVSLLLTERQQLSLEQAVKIAQFFGWKKLEAKYFMTLVQLSRAGSETLRHYHREEMTALQQQAKKLSDRLDNYRGLTEEQRTRFYSSAIYSIVRLTCSIGEHGQSLVDLTEILKRPYSELQDILNFLVDGGLVLEKNGRYFLGDQHTHLPKESPHLLRHQTNWRLQAIHQSDKLSDDELMFTGPMTMSEQDFMRVRESLVQLIQQTVQTMKESPGEVLVCLNIDWFKAKL